MSWSQALLTLLLALHQRRVIVLRMLRDHEHAARALREELEALDARLAHAPEHRGAAA